MFTQGPEVMKYTVLEFPATDWVECRSIAAEINHIETAHKSKTPYVRSFYWVYNNMLDDIKAECVYANPPVPIVPIMVVAAGVGAGGGANNAQPLDNPRDKELTPLGVRSALGLCKSWIIRSIGRSQWVYLMDASLSSLAPDAELVANMRYSWRPKEPKSSSTI